MVNSEDQAELEVPKPHLLVHGSSDNLQHVVATSLDEATSYAEFLVNEQGDDSVRIFEMRELDISFKTYYQVHVSGARQSPSPPDEPNTFGFGDDLDRKVVPLSA